MEVKTRFKPKADFLHILRFLHVLGIKIFIYLSLLGEKNLLVSIYGKKLLNYLIG